ncbi:hypothetical protein GYMLUDRAFT_86670 [Collybiopsis luxurians FD-317 M1]|uniref:Arrestin-like N-terminal domain-containing protein n=1 Tax=Collybiopsis luxurians FD-317 M1 TaxID=944289 RepID=A0A0D0BRF4_9AGAR|nr:hypothetical protein GYMLUDRAFT_86670 [Collybiopsis luxurians FD-317 M1]
MAHLHQLPSYYPSCSPPSYSPHPLEGETFLDETRRAHSSSYLTGIFTKHVGNITISLLDQDQDVDVPSDGRHGLLTGIINFDPSLNIEDVVEVVLKVEGRIKLNISGSNAVSKAVEIVDDQYELWSTHVPGSSTSAECPRSISFSAILPNNFRDEGRELPLPPSYELRHIGITDLSVKCTYTLRAIVKTHGSLWNHRKIVSTPFIYRPRKRPPQPIISMPFLSTVKALPEEWFQATTVLKARPSVKLNSIDASIFVPAVRSFGVRDWFPYHIQLSGTIASLKEFYSHAQYKPEKKSTLSSSTIPFCGRLNNLMLNMSVSLRRQVWAELKGQSVWKSSLIGTGTLTALPPSITLDSDLSNRVQDSEMTLDWESEVQCREDVRVGHFDAGKISITDFLVFSIASKPNQGAFNALQIIVPISLVTDTWVEP